jgi:hypothetical protein
MSGELVERARVQRGSGAVLKTRLSIIRSRDWAVPVFVFEGDTDVGPYAVWISRIKDDLRYEVLPGAGKDQLLDLRRRLSADSTDLSPGVYYFVDRDFDDLKGQAPGPDLFCTETYSVENYFITEDVLHSLLTDDFRCPGPCADRANVVDLFRRVRSDACAALRDANLRLWRAKKLGIRGPGARDQIAQYAMISFDRVARNPDADLQALISLEREPSDDESVEIDQEFEALVPLERHRGKFLLAFFVRWLELIAAERKRAGQTLFERTLDLKFSAQKLSLRLLATHTPVPTGVREIVQRAITYLPPNVVIAGRAIGKQEDLFADAVRTPH